MAQAPAGREAAAASLPAWALPPDDGRPPVRTVGPRRGRLLPSQQTTLDRLGPAYLRTPDEVAAAAAAGPVVLDVGVGDGASTLALAAAAPEALHVAVEVHRPGLARLYRALEERRVANVVVVEGDVWDVLVRLGPGSLAALQCCFPDPWPKARHLQRRLVGAAFVARAADLLEPGGELRLATDWPDYAEGMRAAVLGEPRLALDGSAGGWSPRFAGRPVTTYEARGRAAGRPVRDLRAVRIDH